MWWLLIRDQRGLAAARYILHALLVIWFCFGVGTAVLVVRDRTSGLSQHMFILFCSLWLAVIPFFIWQVVHFKPTLPQRATKPKPKSKSKKAS